MLRPDSTRNLRHGFTLLEVMVVVAIIGILGGIGVSSMRGVIANSTVKGQVQSIGAFLDQASAHVHSQSNFNGGSLKISGNKIELHSDSVCAAATVVDSFNLDPRTVIVASAPSALPTAFTSLTNWGASSSCIKFHALARIGLNPLDSTGYIHICSTQQSSAHGLVGKVAYDNHPEAYVSKDGGSSWGNP